ncbi:Ank 2 and/or DUF1421 domain containing protein [Asbolus verrucosus]|uniref:Ank 2 and/or DUF1421 domain containing protein n=1 Tax=Asbolus verrucosus TaxID=1661398 RepID=A0A482VCD7_ASBVE|nr:Ank 2 and/or DUF1421 domain containing protein [Asbolus verrucosus]
MDVTFTNVLEGARQYFQGLPTATSSTAGPTYSNSSESLLRSNETEQNSEIPPSSAGYWPPQQEATRPPTREQTPVQRPPSHHSDSSRPPSHSQLANIPSHYQGNYQEQSQIQQSFQFPRPHSREAPSNVTQHQYQHVHQNPPYHQPPSPQQPRTPSRQEQMVTPPSSSQSYHQMQNSGQTSQGYHNYQQRSYYPVPSQSKSQMPASNNTYKVASSQPHSQNSQENAYYKHLYSPHSQSSSQLQYSNTKGSLSHAMQENKHDQGGASQNQNTSQAYRTTHNLPPIASLSLISYHSNRNNRDVIRTSNTKTRTLPTNSLASNAMNQIPQSAPKPSISASNVQQNSMRMSGSYSTEGMQHDYRNSSQYTNQQNRLPVNQNYQYGTTTTTQNYSQVIMTTSNSSNSYPTPVQNQSSSTTQQYYQTNKHPSSDVQRSHHPSNMLPQQTPVQQQQQTVDRNVNGRVAPVIKQKRESPLDLSVKTVRTPADSTLDDAEQEARSKYYANNNRTSNSSLASHNYPTYDVYANSFQRSHISRSAQLPSATAPKVEFHPNFNVSSLNHSHLNSYRRNPNVPDKNTNAQRVTYEKNSAYPATQQNAQNRYPTVTVPTAAHVNSYIQSTPQLNKRSENLPRIDFPTPGHGHKTSAHYPVPTHDTQKKRPADTAPSSIIPNKMSKVDTWRQSIDQQIEQRLSSYKQQQAKHNSANKPALVNGNYPTMNQERPKEMYNAYQNRQQYQTVSQHHAYTNANQYQLSQNNHNQTYVPSAGAHQYPGYAAYPTQQQQQQSLYPQHNLSRTNSNPSISAPGVNKNNLGGANKRVLSLLRNSLEIKGAKEAQKKLEQEQLNRSYENLHKHSRLDIQHPSTDVTAPLQPKPGFNNRHNVSPFTPTNLPESNNSLTSMYKLHLPKAIDSVNFDCESGKYLGQNSDRQLEDSQSLINSHANSNGDLDGLAAFLAARIRTKAELKQVGPSQNTCNNNLQLQGIIENQLKTPIKQETFTQNSINGSSNSVSPPKLMKERHAFPPRRKLFSRNEDDSGNSGNVPLRDKTGLRSSSETSVFDFPDSDSEGEMPVLEMQTLEDMRRDRKSSTKQVAEVKSESPRSLSPSDDIFTQACDSFMEQLKSGSGKKRGRRKKIEPDVLAKLQTVTKEKPLDLDMTIKKEVGDEVKTNENKTEVAANASTKNEAEDDDSDVPLINCKNKTGDVSTTSLEDAKPLNKSKLAQQLSASLNDIRDLGVCTSNLKAKEPEQKTPKKEPVENSVLNEIPSVLPRPAKKPSFGDGSHFCPGWEEEVYKYKKSLRMPPSLIQVTRPPQYHRLSTSLPDLDPCPNSPTPSSVADATEYPKTKLTKIKSENLDSDTESNHSFNLFSNKHNYDSEGSCSIKSLPNTTKESSSILDKLLKRCGGREKRKHKRKDDVHPKVTPKPEKVVELLPTPGFDIDTPEIKKSDSGPVSPGFRKKTIDSFKEVFLKKTKDIHSRTRKQTRILKQRVTIKEVFGEDRPASAPPVTCVNHIKIKEELPDMDDSLNLSSLIKKEDETASSDFADTRQVLKNKLLNRGRKENNLLKSLVDKKIKSELLDEQDQDGQDEDDLDDGSKGDADSKSETPSIDGDEGGLSGKKQRNKFRNIRRKFSSGFDYIRKKKKHAKKDNQENETTMKPKRRGQISSKSNPGSVQDIQKEIKGWVLNKGIGETILHRSARLGYTDITAYCLEKMECSPSPKDNAGYTPLHEASTKGHLGIAKMLLMYGANVSESARGGIRPLHEAVENGYVEIVRLLLSYGADPILATYSGMTPLALASDDATVKLLQNHINDVEGNPSSPWDFAGPASCFDLKDSGFDVLDDDPVPDPPSEEEDVDFEVSDHVLPNLYTLRGESPNDRWILLQDLSSLLKIKSRDALLRQICPPTSSTAHVNYKSVLRELKMSDFLEQAHCCQFLNIGEKINTRASKIALVKYTDKVKELLNVEKVTISVR